MYILPSQSHGACPAHDSISLGYEFSLHISHIDDWMMKDNSKERKVAV